MIATVGHIVALWDAAMVGILVGIGATIALDHIRDERQFEEVPE